MSSYDVQEKTRDVNTPTRQANLRNKGYSNGCSNQDDYFFTVQMKTLEEDVHENYKSKSKLSNYDSSAT